MAIIDLEERAELYEDFLEEMFEEGLDDSDDAFEAWLEDYYRNKRELEDAIKEWKRGR